MRTGVGSDRRVQPGTTASMAVSASRTQRVPVQQILRRGAAAFTRPRSMLLLIVLPFSRYLARFEPTSFLVFPNVLQQLNAPNVHGDGDHKLTTRLNSLNRLLGMLCEAFTRSAISHRLAVRVLPSRDDVGPVPESRFPLIASPSTRLIRGREAISFVLLPEAIQQQYVSARKPIVPPTLMFLASRTDSPGKTHSSARLLGGGSRWRA